MRFASLRRGAAGPILILAAVALIYTGPALLPGRYFLPLDLPRDLDAWKASAAERVRVSNSLLSDTLAEFLAWDTAIERHLAAGEMPWRNPLAGRGGPLFANPQTALFFPLMWPRYLLGLGGWGIMALFKLLAAGLGMYWLVVELGGARKEAALSALVFMASGYMVTALLFAHTNVFAMLPWLAAGSLRHLREPTARHAAALIAIAALATAGGHPETLMLGVLAIAAWLIWEVRGDVVRLLPVSICWALGFMLLAVQLIPFLDLLGRSYSREMRLTLPSPGFRLPALVSMVLPGFLGSPLRHELDFTGLLHFRENFLLRSIGYVSVVVLVALAASARQLPKAYRRGLVIGVVALIIALRPPGIGFILKFIPVVRLAAVEYFALIFVFFAAAAAGPAVVAAASMRRRRLGLALAAAGLVLFLGSIVPAVGAFRPLVVGIARSGIAQLRGRGVLRLPPEVYEERLAYYLEAAKWTALRRAAIPGACWIAAGVALYVARRRSDAVVAAAAALELLAFGVGFNPTVRREEAAPVPEVIQVVRNLEVYPANLGTIHGVREVVSYDFLASKEEMQPLLEAHYDPLVHTFPPILNAHDVEVLQSLGVRYVISRVPVPLARQVAALLYELPHPVPHPLPPNLPPDLLRVGIAITLVALVAALGYVQLYRV